MAGYSQANINADIRLGDDEDFGYGGGCSGTLSMTDYSAINRTGRRIYDSRPGCREQRLHEPVRLVP